jgi:hypothetical protein
MKRTMVAVSVVAALVAGVLGGVRPAAAAPSLWIYKSLSIGGSYQPLVGDFGGDAADDVFWYGPGTAADSLWFAKTGQRGSGAFTKVSQRVNGTFKPVVGDFAGDEHDDVFWYAPGPAADFLWVNDGTGHFTSSARPVGGYFTAHRLINYQPGGKDDIFWYDKYSDHPEYLWRTAEDSSGAISTDRFDTPPLATPVVGDWNGDGYEDVFLYGSGTLVDQKLVLLPDGTRQATRVNVGGVYSPVVVYDVPNDGILWWGQGAKPEAYWRSSGRSFVSTPVRTVDGVGRLATLPTGAAIVSGTDVYDALFVGTDEKGEFYELADEAHEKGNEQPVVGDFDNDGGSDVIWFGPGSAKDELWYLNLDAAGDAAVAKGLRVDPRRSGLVGAAAGAGGSAAGAATGS